MSYQYAGSELELFAHAVNWKAYWASLAQPHVGQEVLDVGAGIGSTARNLSVGGCTRWVELEPDAAMAGHIRELVARGELPPSVQVMTGTIDSLAPEDRFDTILYVDVLEHIEDDGRELQSALQRLKPGGRIVILAPAHNWLYTPFDRHIGHFRRYTKSALLAIKPPELDVLHLQYVDSVGMLASLANKLFLKASHPKVGQIRLWDRLMVPASRIVDRLTLGHIGKSVFCVMELPSQDIAVQRR